LRYWVNVINANAAQVGSDLRQMIAGSFAENGIVITYPQRDLHLDATRPVVVEIATGQGANPVAPSPAPVLSPSTLRNS
jgi:potassium-dependent mechanosensitive channel